MPPGAWSKEKRGLEGDSYSRHSGGSRNPAIFELELQTNLDAGFHRHDEFSLRLKARYFNAPRE
jgi:hypothetical protein